MKLTRREFIRHSAAATAAAVAGIPLPADAANVVTDSEYTKLNGQRLRAGSAVSDAASTLR